MKKLTALLFSAIILFSSCAETETYEFGKFGEPNYTVIKAKPYGWANHHERFNPNIEYGVCGQNIFWDIVFIETIIVPVWLTGWQLYQPEGVLPCAPNCDTKYESKVEKVIDNVKTF